MYQRSHDNPHDFTAYLAGTLVPDLEASGSDATAADFREAIDWIGDLTAERDRLAARVSMWEAARQSSVADVRGFGQVTADESADGWCAAVLRLLELATDAGHAEALAAVLGAASLTSGMPDLHQLYAETVAIGWDDAARNALERARSRADALAGQTEGCTPDCAEFGHSAVWHADAEGASERRAWAARGDR